MWMGNWLCNLSWPHFDVLTFAITWHAFDLILMSWLCKIFWFETSLWCFQIIRQNGRDGLFSTVIFNNWLICFRYCFVYLMSDSGEISPSRSRSRSRGRRSRSRRTPSGSSSGSRSGSGSPTRESDDAEEVNALLQAGVIKLCTEHNTELVLKKAAINFPL